MALGDGIRRNIASVDPSERARLRDALLELNRRFYPGQRTDTVPGHVTLWFTGAGKTPVRIGMLDKTTQ